MPRSRPTPGCWSTSPTRDCSCASSTSGCSAVCRCPRAVRSCPSEIAHIARDPFDPAYDLADVVARLRRKRTGIKRALLDQQLVGGVGNIYADEALWRARLHYARATDTLPRPAAVGLLTAAADVMAEALQAGGTSFDSLYVNVNGASGYFDRSLAVYGREGEPCPRCGTAIRREAFMNRSSYPLPALPADPERRPRPLLRAASRQRDCCRYGSAGLGWSDREASPPLPDRPAPPQLEAAAPVRAGRRLRRAREHGRADPVQQGRSGRPRRGVGPAADRASTSAGTTSS